jgi:flagellar biogenesis protein FliO
MRVQFLRWAARAGRADQRAIVRLSSQALTPQASVHAVQWNGEEFLLGCTAQQVTLLSRRSAPGSAGEPA